LNEIKPKSNLSEPLFKKENKMKKLVQISLAIVLTFTFLMGVFQLTRDVWTNVGWNSGTSASAPQGEQFAGCTFCGLLGDPGVTPYVGWNSGI
jgi:hypothetical protein